MLRMVSELLGKIVSGRVDSFPLLRLRRSWLSPTSTWSPKSIEFRSGRSVRHLSSPLLCRTTRWTNRSDPSFTITWWSFGRSA